MDTKDAPLDTDNPLLAEIQARYTAARDHASKWREEAREDFRFYSGNQWNSDDLQKMEEQQRPVVTFNRIMRLVNAVIGHEANNRAEVRYIPRTMGDAKVNELLTNAGAYFRDECDAEFEESDAFRDMIICGMGWTNDRLSDASNPDYDLIEERVDPMEMLWDPAAKKSNLADSRYLFRRKRYTEKEVKTIWPDFKGPITSAFEDESDDLESSSHESNPRNRYQSEDGRTNDVKPDVLVLEYQYKEREGYYVISHPQGGESIDLPSSEMDDELKEKLKKSGITPIFKRRTVHKRCFVIGRQIVQGPDDVYPGGFTYHCMTGFREREHNHWFGIVRMLKDPQRWSNKWLAQIMHILNSNAKGGLMAEEDAVNDRNQFEASWADPAAVTWFASGALKDARVQPKPPPLYPQGVDRLLEYANTSFTDVSGVNQELLGLADREQPGVLEWQRKQSAVTLLAPLFDSLRRFRKMQGRCWLYMMQRYVSDGRIIRITQDAPDGQQQQIGVPFGGGLEMQAQIADPRWKMPETAQYDVIVDQAPTAPNQKEQTWSALTQLFPVIKDAMPPSVMMLAVEYSPLPESFVEKLKELVAKEQQKGPPPNPEMMKVQAQIQMMQQQAQIKERESQVNLLIKQKEGEMKLQLQREEMELKRQEAELDFAIAQQQAQQKMWLSQQDANLKAQQQQQQFQIDAQSQERQAALDERAQEAQMARDDEASAADIKRQDAAAKAKARRQPTQPRNT